MAVRLNPKFTRFPLPNPEAESFGEVTLRLKGDLQTSEGAEIDATHIQKLIADTDPQHLMPPKKEQEKPSGQKDDWAKVSWKSITGMFITEY